MILAIAISLVVLGVVEMPWSAVLIVGAVLFEVTETSFFFWWSKRRRAAVGAESLIGRTAVAVEELRPTGQVKIDGELWAAYCEAGAAAGAKVVVRGLEGLTLEVEPASA